MPTEPPDEDDDDTRPLRELRRIAGGTCWDCRARYTAHEAVGSVALGFKDAPRCFACLARRLVRDPDDLRRQLEEYVHRRDCFLRAWREADRMEAGATDRPPRSAAVTAVFVPPSAPPISPPAADVWDAADMGCGELVMQLRIRLNNLPPGAVFTVTATDPAAPEDIPAWCRLTGHSLAAAAHPVYRIRRRQD